MTDPDPGGQLNLAESRSGSGSYLDIFVAIEIICFRIGSKSLKNTKIQTFSLNFFLFLIKNNDPDPEAQI
jgi:hypothetical protein